MKERIPNTHITPPAPLKRRELLCAVAAAGGAIIAANCSAEALPTRGTGISDPQLREAMLRYGGEFGQLGKGGFHGDL